MKQSRYCMYLRSYLRTFVRTKVCNKFRDIHLLIQPVHVLAPVKTKVDLTILQLSRPWRYFRLLMIIRACQLRILPATSQRVTDVSPPVSPLLVADSKLIGCRRVTTRTDHRGSNGRTTLPMKYAKSSVHRGSPQDTLYGLAAGAHSDKSIRVSGSHLAWETCQQISFCFRDCMLPSEDPKRSRSQYAFLSICRSP